MKKAPQGNTEGRRGCVIQPDVAIELYHIQPLKEREKREKEGENMVRLKISYDSIGELTAIINILGNAVKSMRIVPKQTGEHKRAYIDIVDGIEKAEITRDENSEKP